MILKSIVLMSMSSVGAFLAGLFFFGGSGDDTVFGWVRAANRRASTSLHPSSYESRNLSASKVLSLLLVLLGVFVFFVPIRILILSLVIISRPDFAGRLETGVDSDASMKRRITQFVSVYYPIIIVSSKNLAAREKKNRGDLFFLVALHQIFIGDEKTMR